MTDPAPETPERPSDFIRDIVFIQENLYAIEAHVELAREAGHSVFPSQVDTPAQCRQADKPVQGPAVEERPAKAPRDESRNGSLARPGRPIDGNNPDPAHCSRAIARPVDRATSSNAGNEVSTLAQSSIRMAACARSAAIANAIAMRWSP